LTKDLSSNYARFVLLFAIVYIVIGAIALGVWWWLNNKKPLKPDTTDKPSSENIAKPTSTASKT
jgi:hypothetical protein